MPLLCQLCRMLVIGQSSESLANSISSEVICPDGKVQRHLVYFKYWTLNLMPPMVYPEVLFPPNLSPKVICISSRYALLYYWSGARGSAPLRRSESARNAFCLKFCVSCLCSHVPVQPVPAAAAKLGAGAGATDGQCSLTAG